MWKNSSSVQTSLQRITYYISNQNPSVTHTNIFIFITISLSLMWFSHLFNLIVHVRFFSATQQHDEPVSPSFCLSPVHTLQASLAGVPEPPVNTHLSPCLLYESCTNAATPSAVTLAPTANTFICYQLLAHIYAATICFSSPRVRFNGVISRKTGFSLCLLKKGVQSSVHTGGLQHGACGHLVTSVEPVCHPPSTFYK